MWCAAVSTTVRYYQGGFHEEDIILARRSLTAVFLFTRVPSVSTDTGYAGAEACKGCHDTYYDSYMHTRMAKKPIAGSPAAQFGCESSTARARSMSPKGAERGSPSSASQDARLPRNGPQNASPAMRYSAPGSPGTCQSTSQQHRMHGLPFDAWRARARALKMGQPTSASTATKTSGFRQTSSPHHPIREGKITCTPVMTRMGPSDQDAQADTVNELCYKSAIPRKGRRSGSRSACRGELLNCHAVHGSNHNSFW